MSEALLTTAWLAAEHVSRRYPNGRGVGPIDLTVDPGEVQALVGPNGSGKTTLLRCLATRSRPDSGRLAWFGDQDRRLARRRLAVVFDATAHADELSARSNLAFFGTARAIPRAAWEPALAEASVAEVSDDPLALLSFGMRRRVLLAEALVGDPPLLLLDEPTLGLDVNGRNWLAGAVRARANQGLATCLSTNDTDFVEQVATRVCFLVDGEVVRDAPLPDLLAELGGTREVRLSYRGPSPAPLVRSLPGVDRAVEAEGCLLILAQQREGLIADILASLGDVDTQLVDLMVSEPGLADCFLRLTGRLLHV